MGVSYWDVNRKIPYAKLYNDIKRGKYPGVKIKETSKGEFTYFTILIGKLWMEVDSDELSRVPKGMADRFGMTLPGFNDHGEPKRFFNTLEKEYGAKFVSDFEFESHENPAKVYKRFQDSPKRPHNHPQQKIMAVRVPKKSQHETVMGIISSGLVGRKS